MSARNFSYGMSLARRSHEFANTRRFTLKSFWWFIVAVAFMFTLPTFAQKLVDPNAVAPEYREAAEKRRAEQIRQRECAHKADEAKVLPRDRTAHITQCLADDSQGQPSALPHQ
jgi:hypothetical protein